MIPSQVVVTAGRVLGSVLVKRRLSVQCAQKEQQALSGAAPKQAGDGARAFAERARAYQARKLETGRRQPGRDLD
jgi:hypothetical protein